MNAFSGTKCCPSVLETVGIRVASRNIRNFSMFTCSSSHCPKLDVFQWQMQFVNVQTFLVTHV
jgi:hypothetical protein